MTAYLIANDATWIGFSSFHAGDRLIVTPNGSLVMPDASLSDVGAGGPTALSFGGLVYLGDVLVDSTVSFSITSTGHFVSDTQGAALRIGQWSGSSAGAAHLDNAGWVSVQNGVAVQTAGAGNSITNSGRIMGDVGVNLASNLDSLLNTGVIVGITHAVHMQGFGLNLTNTGSLSASHGSAVLVNGDSGSIFNSGSITGLFSAIEVAAGVFSFHLTNSGSITGDITSAGAAQDLIVNSGTITGNVSLGVGKDSFRGGHLVGDLSMGLGNDTVDARAAAVSGVISDAGGSDTYLVDGATRIVDTGAGVDTVFAWSSFQLSSGLEVLQLQGFADLTGIGNAPANTMTGNAGDNRLLGGAGDDKLYGGSGDDILRGGLGVDRLTGGDGADTFIFARGQTGSTAASADTITDFAEGQDHINLSGYNGLTFIGAGAFTHMAAQLHAMQVGGDNWVEMDMNGDSVADAVIRLVGLHNLSAADFVL